MPYTQLPGIRITHCSHYATQPADAGIFGHGCRAAGTVRIADEPMYLQYEFLPTYNIQFYCHHGDTVRFRLTDLISGNWSLQAPDNSHIRAGERARDYYVTSELSLRPPVKLNMQRIMTREELAGALESSLRVRAAGPRGMLDVITVTDDRMRLSDILTTIRQAGRSYQTVHCYFCRV